MSNTAIVTGYSAGLGREFTATLLREGWSVVGVSRNTEDEQLDQQYPGKLTVVHGPVDEQETVDAAFAAATSAATDAGTAELMSQLQRSCAGAFDETTYEGSSMRFSLDGAGSSGMSGAPGVILLSGDRHHADISATEQGPLGYPLHEHTSSGLTHANNFEDRNRYRVAEQYTRENFGVLELDWERGRVQMRTHGIEGEIAVQHTLELAALGAKAFESGAFGGE